MSTTDEDWRAEKFTQEAIISAKLVTAQAGNATVAQLETYMRKYGPEGVLESAILLPRKQYERLEALAKRMSYDRRAHKWIEVTR